METTCARCQSTCLSSLLRHLRATSSTMSRQGFARHQTIMMISISAPVASAEDPLSTGSTSKILLDCCSREQAHMLRISHREALQVMACCHEDILESYLPKDYCDAAVDEDTYKANSRGFEGNPTWKILQLVLVQILNRPAGAALALWNKKWLDKVQNLNIIFAFNIFEPEKMAKSQEGTIEKYFLENKIFKCVTLSEINTIIIFFSFLSGNSTFFVKTNWAKLRIFAF